MRARHGWIVALISMVSMVNWPSSAGAAGDDDGSTGHNKLHPTTLYDNLKNLQILMNDRLLTTIKGSVKRQKEFEEIIAYQGPEETDNKKGKLLLDYAVSCAVGRPVGMQHTFMHRYNNTDYKFTGEDLLKRPVNWLKKALGPEARRQLLTCLATRLNPENVDVVVWMGGNSVNPQVEPLPLYPYREAVWLVTFPWEPHPGCPPDRPCFNVWPFTGQGSVKNFVIEKAQAADENAFLSALAKRACGKDPTQCGMVNRGDPTKDPQCQEHQETHRWRCLEKDAIHTRLSEPAIGTLYLTGLGVR